jgi:hypothetical protein
LLYPFVWPQTAPIQTLTLVSGPTLPVGVYIGYGSISADGQWGIIPLTSAGSSSARIVARVSIAGVVDLSTTYSTDGYQPRGAASPDGITMYAGDGHGVWYGSVHGTLVSGAFVGRCCASRCPSAIAAAALGRGNQRMLACRLSHLSRPPETRLQSTLTTTEYYGHQVRTLLNQV